MSSLIVTGKYGVLNSQRLLNSTSNNINNVSTEGYIRKDTITYTSVVNWGVGDTYTRRIYDQYVQRQLFTDTANSAYYHAYSEGLNVADNVLSDPDISIANSISNFFDSLSTATDSPTSSGSRETALAKLRDVVTRFTTTSDNLLSSLSDVNAKINDSVDDINSYTKAICDLNDEIRTLSISNTEIRNEVYMQMLDERDRLVGKLAEQVSINVQTQQDGTYDVYLNSGMLLCNGDTYAIFDAATDAMDPTKTNIHMSFKCRVDGANEDKTNVKMTLSDMGGKLGGLINSTVELRQSMRELGKLYVSLADALNEQNKAGFTLDDVAGQNLLNIKDVWAVSSNPADSMLCTFNENEGENVQGFDFLVNCAGGEMKLFTVDSFGRKTDITDKYTFSGTDTSINLKDYGITLNFNKSVDTLVNNKTEFFVQPTLLAGSTASVAIAKPEDFAFASAVRTRTGNDNYGNATISLSRISNTGDNYGVKVKENTGKPEFNDKGAVLVKIEKDADGELCYNVYAKDGSLLGQAPGSCNGVNVFENAVTLNADGTRSTTKIADQGYDVNVIGTIKENDSFTVELNEGGQADNSNGIALVKLRTTQLVHTTGGEKTSTITESYSNLLAQVGSAVSSANANAEAADAKLEQTTALYESDSGVNLDEEAVNLLQYQQSYQACAKIIEASQTIFNALIAVM